MKLVLALFLLSSIAFAATKKIDPKTSKVGFDINKYKIGKMIDGKFDKFSGSFDFDSKANTIKDIKAEIEIASINTEDEKRDGHLKSPDFFDADKFSKMTFESKGNVKLNKKEKILGKLTLKGVTKEVELEIKKIKSSKKGIEIQAEGIIDRYDFGITWNKRMDTDKEESIVDQIGNAAKGLINKYVIDNKVNVKLNILAN